MSTEYGADQIQILEGLEAVRKRPGMYIDDTSFRGLHHLVYEIVDNSIDEALAGYCTHIQVTIHKVGGGGYKVSGGLHGVGASVVNALSDWLEVTIYSEGKIYRQRYERGKVCYPLEVVGTCLPSKTGTSVSFLPDKTMFEVTEYDFKTLQTRLREMAFLTKGLKITLTDEREDPVRSKIYHYEGGIQEFVQYLKCQTYIALLIGISPHHQRIVGLHIFVLP